MLNPFLNTEEQRLRAFLRILIFLFISSFLLVIPSLIPFSGFDYILRSLLIFGFYFVMLRFVDHRPWRESGLIPHNKWMQECAAGIGIAATVMGLIFLVEWLSGTLTVTGFGWQRNGEIYWLFPVFGFLIQMISVGFYEEIIARGYILRNIAEGFSMGSITPKWGAVIAVIISSALFGLGHAGNPNIDIFAVLNIFFAGVMLAVPFIITGRLAFSIGIHFAWNFFQGGVFGFRVSGLEVRNSIIQVQQAGPDWFTGGSFGPEGGIVGLIGIGLVMGTTILFLKLRGTEIDFATTFSKKYQGITEN